MSIKYLLLSMKFIYLNQLLIFKLFWRFILMDDSNYYSLFLKFIETYGPIGFKGVQKDDSLVLKLDTLMDKNNQFFYIGNMIEWDLIYSSKRSLDMFVLSQRI